MTISQSTLCYRLSSLGLRQGEVHSLLNQFQKWKRNNGVPYAVERIKFAKLACMKMLAGERIPDSPVSWFDLDKGPFGRLIKLVNDSSLPFKRRARLFNALMVYTTEVRTGEPSIDQWNKFQRSVEESPAEDRRYVEELLNTPFARTIKLAIAKQKLGNAPALWKQPWSPTRRAPATGKTVAETEVSLWEPSFYQSSYNRETFSQAVDDVFGTIYGNKPGMPVYPKSLTTALREGNNSEGYVGHIGFIQEPGLKLRAVANPHRLTQLALEPLRRNLANVLKKVSGDCTYDQQAGIRQVAKVIASGQKVWCIDLSDATNNFPYSLQRGLLDDTDWKRSRHHYVLDRAVKGPWRVKDPTTGKVRSMRWNKGQPLGLGPSFPLFALAHHVLARHTLGKGNYLILGDDIVTTVPPKAYLEGLQKLGVPVSVSKCFASNKLAEFAGAVITPEGVIPTVKWRQMSDRNFLSYTRFFGHRLIGGLPKRQRRVARALAEIPEWYGGLGFNPKGRSFKERLDRAFELGLLNDRYELLPKCDRTVPLETLVSLGIARQPTRSELDQVAAVERPVLRRRDETTLERIERLVGVKSGVYTPSERKDLNTTVKPTGDPRGVDALTLWENRLGFSTPRKRGEVGVSPTTKPRMRP